VPFLSCFLALILVGFARASLSVIHHSEEDPMKRIAIISLLLLLVSQTASAGATWSTISISVSPPDAAQVVAAADKLMSSPTGKTFPGRLLLQAVVAGGASPVTHVFVPIYKTAADREAFVQKLQADPAWAQFQATMAKLSAPHGTVMYNTLKSWGDISDTDVVWQGHAFAVKDPAAFVAALDKFMTSETGKKFPGQVHLSSVVAGGISPVTHSISVGFASDVERASWGDAMQGNADWEAYVEASRKAADYLGNNLLRDIRTWGKATLKELTTGAAPAAGATAGAGAN
jgi:hypothetical protein